MEHGIWMHVDAIYGHMTKQECEALAEMARHCRSWVELGSFCGRSLLCVGLHLPAGARLISVDWQSGRTFRGGQNLYSTVLELTAIRPDLEVAVIKGDSAKSAAWLPDVDAVFIDADHSYHAVRADIQAWAHKARKYISGHDWQMESVRQAVQELLPGAKPTGGSVWSLNFQS